MIEHEGKYYYPQQDVEKCIADIAQYITNKTHIITFYRGGLPLSVRLSNQFNLPLSILDYQTYDNNVKTKNNVSVSFMKNAGIKEGEDLLIVDDIADSGDTINTALKFLEMNYSDSNNKKTVYTMIGNNEKHPKEWKYKFKHLGWSVFNWESDFESNTNIIKG